MGGAGEEEVRGAGEGRGGRVCRVRAKEWE